MGQADTSRVEEAYRSLNERDLDGFGAAFAEDAVWYGGGGEVAGREAIVSVIRELIALSGDTLEVDINDVLANEGHTVVLQTTKARLGDRVLEDRVVYVFHMNDEGLIQEAFFNGDPSVQNEFYGAAASKG